MLWFKTGKWELLRKNLDLLIKIKKTTQADFATLTTGTVGKWWLRQYFLYGVNNVYSNFSGDMGVNWKTEFGKIVDNTCYWSACERGHNIFFLFFSMNVRVKFFVRTYRTVYGTNLKNWILENNWKHWQQGRNNSTWTISTTWLYLSHVL